MTGVGHAEVLEVEPCQEHVARRRKAEMGTQKHSTNQMFRISSSRVPPIIKLAIVCIYFRMSGHT